MEERLVEENTLWTTIPTVPDLQHFATSAPKRKPSSEPHMRIMPPNVSAASATRTTKACGTLPSLAGWSPQQRMKQKASSYQHSQCGWVGCGQQRHAHPFRAWLGGQMLSHDQSAYTRCGPRRAAQTKSGRSRRKMFCRVTRCIIRIRPQGLLEDGQSSTRTNALRRQRFGNQHRRHLSAQNPSIWVDAHCRHRAGCTRSGRLRKRTTPTERMLSRICPRN